MFSSLHYLFVMIPTTKNSVISHRNNTPPNVPDTALHDYKAVTSTESLHKLNLQNTRELLWLSGGVR